MSEAIELPGICKLQIMRFAVFAYYVLFAPLLPLCCPQNSKSFCQSLAAGWSLRWRSNTAAGSNHEMVAM